VGLAYLPEPLVADHIASGALVAVMNRYPVPPAGIFVVRAPQSLSVGESEDAHGDAY
jgi:DNA-binding transcriptional LysR family regulator